LTEAELGGHDQEDQMTKVQKRKAYVPPKITKVKFEDRSLVTFAVCRKETQLEQDADSCCNILPDHQANYNNFDPS
jgi:hypothetical protein